MLALRADNTGAICVQNDIGPGRLYQYDSRKFDRVRREHAVLGHSNTDQKSCVGPSGTFDRKRYNASSMTLAYLDSPQTIVEQEPIEQRFAQPSE